MQEYKEALCAEWEQQEMDVGNRCGPEQKEESDAGGGD